MKPLSPKLATYAWRGLLIAVLAGAILAIGFSRGRAVFQNGRPSPTGPARVLAELDFAPLPDSRLLRSYPVSFNGEKSLFAQYRSSHSARDVIAQFEERYGQPTDQEKATEGTMVRVVTPAYSLAGGLDSAGNTLGVVAFDEPKSGGSTYFVGRSARPASGWRHGDAPGEEVPGIPRPLRSQRILCIDGLGGITSRLLVYEGWGDIADSAERFVAEMPKAGWTRNADVERVIQDRLPGTFLSFLKGTERAMVYIEREKDTSKVRTAVVYSIKGWLPPDRGL